MTCPCPDDACQDVHAHDVTAVLTVKIDIPAMLAGLMKGGTGGTQPAME